MVKEARKEINYDEILNLRVEDYDLTIAEFFESCMMALWMEGESFSGKRPFGNSGWEYDIINALAAGDFIKSKKKIFDGGGFADYTEYTISDQERKKADKIIKGVIKHIFNRHK